MATVFKRPTSRFWFACYRDRNGDLCRTSTKLTEKAQALRIALELEQVERKAKTGSASTFQFQTVVNQVAKELTGESLPSPSVQAYFEEFLNRVKKSNSPATYERYQHSVKRFIMHIGKAGSQPLRNISPVMIESFLHDRMEAGVSAKTAIIDVKTLSIALRRAENLGYIPKNPVPAVTMPKATSLEREVFSIEEVDKLVAAAPNVDWQTAILMGFYLGARLGDCVAMTWDNVDAEKGLFVYLQKKTGKEVTVPLHARLIAHLHHVSETSVDGPLCPTLFNKTPGGKHGLSEGFKRIVKRAGLDLMTIKGTRDRNFSRRTFHSLRHSFSSALANAGVSEEIRMKLTGHRSPDIHRKYTHLNTAPLKEAINSLHTIPTNRH